MPGYINILQGKIARFEQNTTPSSVAGFFTDGLVTCCVLVLSGQKDGKRRISAFHSDSYLLNNDKQRLLEEVQWVGNLESFCVYRDPSYNADTDHPMLVFAHENNLPVEIISFDSRDENQTELFIIFNQSIRQKGYTHRVSTSEDDRGVIFNHEHAAKIYSHYKLNVMMQEVHSNNIFDQKSRADHALMVRWNNRQMTFQERRSITRHNDSLLEHNLVLFDGQRFTTPGKHDLTLTIFATQFFKNYKQIDLNSARIKQIMSAIEIPTEQAAIIALMQDGDSTIILHQRGGLLDGVIKHSAAICDLYLFIKHKLSLDVVNILDTKEMLALYLENVKTFASWGAEEFRNNEYGKAICIFETTLEYSKLCFPPDSKDMGIAHYNLGSAYHEYAMEKYDNALLGKAQMNLRLALGICTINGDTYNAQKSQNRITKISLEPFRRMHSIMAPEGLDEMTMQNAQEIHFHILYTFLSPPTGAAELNLTTQAIEMYAAYASRAEQLSFPIFSMTDYGRANIRYCAFLIRKGTQRSGAISAIALYDNYETSSRGKMKLRFFWQSQIAEDGDFYKQYSKEINKLIIKSLQRHDFSLDGHSAQITPNAYICQFTQSPIQSTYAVLAERAYPQEECIIRRFNPSLLTPAKWQSMPRLPDANGQPLLGNEFHCFRFTGTSDEEVQAIAHQNALFLKRENKYDVALKIQQEDAANYDIYLITNQERTLCIGAFIFQKKESRHVHNAVLDMRQMYSEKMQDKHLDPQKTQEFLERKFANNLRKERDNEGKGGRLDRSLFSPANPHDKAVIKYNTKHANYQDMLFYWRLKTNIDEKLQAGKTFQYELQVAWIHPFYRRKHLLTTMWPEFQQHYGVFLIDTPSDVMREFIDKRNIHKAGHGFGQSLILG